MMKTLVGDQMIIYGLYGPSGTGKSTSALLFAHEKNIPAIIDDGLLIYRGKRVAGSSAKFEKNYITAVKRAIFYLEDHRDEVRKALQHYPIKKLLIIGTSIRMIDKIADALDIGPVEHYINVTDIRSSSEIKMALYVRKTQGKHVIPIPYVQVEQSFFKTIIMKGKQLFSNKREYIGETTIVHPSFTLGTIQISDRLFKLIIEKEIERINEIKACKHVAISMFQTPTIHIHAHLRYPIARPLQAIGTDIQKRVVDAYQRYFELEIDQVNVRFEQ